MHVNERIVAVEWESSLTYSSIVPPFVALFLFLFFITKMYMEKYKVLYDIFNERFMMAVQLWNLYPYFYFVLLHLQ